MSKLSTAALNADIGGRLVAIRNGSGLTQIEFAERLGLSPRAYANYERGEREMPTALFRLLCDEFRIEPFWLLCGPEDEPLRIGHRRLDMDLLESIIGFIDGWLVKHRRVMKPEKKARVVRLAYEHCVDEGEIDAVHLKEMLSVAA